MEQSRTADAVRIAATQHTAERNFWLEQLSGPWEPASIPPDNSKPETGRVMKTYTIPITGTLARQMEKMAEGSDVRLHIILLSACALLVRRIMQADHFVIGTSIYKQTAEGEYINTVLPLKIDYQEGGSFRHLLSELKKTLRDAISHANYPIEMLLKDLRMTTPEKARFPLFEVALILEGLQSLPYLDHVPYQICFVVGKQSITTSAAYELRIVYNSESYQEIAISRMAGLYLRLLEGAIAGLDQPCDDIELMDHTQCLALIEQLHDAPLQVPSQTNVVKLFEEQARRTPEHLAVYCKGVEYTYSKLNEKAGQLAGRLQASHIRNGDRVAILLDRSTDFIISIFAILKCGAAYIPVSPSYPARRIEYMLHNSEAKLLITNTDHFPHYSKEIPTLALDAKSYADCSPVIELADAIHPEDLAYIIYTSGSTGVPKGVMVTHRNIINLVYGLKACIHDRMGAGPFRVAQLAPFEFDASVQQIMPNLLLGHSLYIVAESDRLSGMKLLEFYRDHRIELSDGTPSHIRMVLESSKETPLPSTLRQFIIAGEVFPKNLAYDLFRRSSDPHLLVTNIYGPTETCVDATIFPIDPQELSRYSSIPIGRALPNQYIYILDRKGRLQPPGLIGELYIGGENVAKGYAQLPGQTAARFLPDPFRPGGFMYRTGDYGKWRHDGNVEFHGRVDDQVKINGYRIELDEITHNLAVMDGIASCSVVAKPGQAELHLVGYVVPDAEKLPLLSNLTTMFHDKVKLDQFAEMPDGIGLFFTNQADARELYNEVFRDQTYDNPNITLGERACIVDVGANIGTFSAFIHMLRPQSTIYTFEPIPAIYDTLMRNRQLYGIAGKSYRKGAAARSGMERFTYYPNSPAMSGRYASRQEESSLLDKVIGNTENNRIAADQKGELIGRRLVTEEIECPVTTLSQFIADENLTMIDLLKIDVEKSEADVLEGIEEKDWDKIRQCIIEVHDHDDRLGKIQRSLEKKNFHCEIRQDAAYKQTSLYTLFAWKPDRAEAKEKPLFDGVDMTELTARWGSAGEITRRIRSEVGKKLPHYMVPEEFIFIPRLPLMPNGKVDKKTLNDYPGLSVSQQADEWADADELTSTLRAIWAEVLKKKDFGLFENFFAIGGNSIKAIQTASRVHQALNIKVTLTDIFNAPTIAELSRLLSSRQEQEHLVIAAAPKRPWYSLSNTQRRFYSAYHLAPSTTAYNLPEFIEVSGPIDRNRLEHAFRQLVSRHESLRTTFIEMEEPVQRIFDAVEFNIDYTDLSLLSPELREQHSQSIMNSFEQPFDLTQAPLLRVGLLKMGADLHILMIDMPHIISDGFSQDVLLQDLMALYKGEELKPLTIQYKDFSVWESSPEQQEKMKRQEQYWRRQFQGEIPVLDITTDLPRSHRMQYAGEMLYDTIDAERAKQIHAWMQSENISFFVLMLAFYNILLAKLSRQNDIVVGTPIIGRRHPELEKVIGAFVNTLAIRSYPKPDKRFREYLQEIKAIAFAAFENQDFRFDKLVEAVAPRHELSRANPLFTAWFAVAANSPDAPEKYIPTELSVKRLFQLSNTTKFELSLTIYDGPDYVSLLFNYCTDLFTQQTARQFLSYYKELVAHVLDHPDLFIRDFEFFSAAASTALAAGPLQDIPVGF